MHLVGCTIRIYYDAQTCEHQIGLLYSVLMAMQFAKYVGGVDIVLLYLWCVYILVL